MTRVTFGVTSSPFLATQVLRQVAKDHEKQHLRAAKIISNFYVDDCLTGAAISEEAREIQEELIALLQCACMWLHKWRSSDTSVVDNVPSNMQEGKVIKLLHLQLSATRLLAYIGTPRKTRSMSQLLFLLQVINLRREK